ncbi:MAG: hypothetical protein ACR2NZ_24660 [Rubripirellula sp.]
MTTIPLNPYESPEEVKRESPEDGSKISRHHLSNRVMAYVLGSIGLLFASVGIAGLLEFLVTMPSPPSGSETSFYTAVTIICVILPLLGCGLLGVAIFLWRYDSSELSTD